MRPTARKFQSHTKTANSSAHNATARVKWRQRFGNRPLRQNNASGIAVTANENVSKSTLGENDRKPIADRQFAMKITKAPNRIAQLVTPRLSDLLMNSDIMYATLNSLR
jgi:hypothetical protein